MYLTRPEGLEPNHLLDLESRMLPVTPKTYIVRRSGLEPEMSGLPNHDFTDRCDTNSAHRRILYVIKWAT